MNVIEIAKKIIKFLLELFKTYNETVEEAGTTYRNVDEDVHIPERDERYAMDNKHRLDNSVSANRNYAPVGVRQDKSFNAEKEYAPVGVRDVQPVAVDVKPAIKDMDIFDLAITILSPYLHRQISKRTLATIVEFSIFPRELVNPITWIVVFDAAYRYGMHHDYFRSRSDSPFVDEYNDFVQPFMKVSGYYESLYLAYVSELDRYKDYNIVMPKNMSELNNMKQDFYVSKDIILNPSVGVKPLVSPVNAYTNQLWVNNWLCALYQGEKYPNGFGRLSGKYHSGIDMNLPMDADNNHPVNPVYPGKIVNSRFQRNGLGNTILLEFEFNGKVMYARYAHLTTRFVKHGDNVSIFDTIGRIGNSSGYIGNSSGYKQGMEFANHLHIDFPKEPNYSMSTALSSLDELYEKYYNIEELYPNG